MSSTHLPDTGTGAGTVLETKASPLRWMRNHGGPDWGLLGCGGYGYDKGLDHLPLPRDLTPLTTFCGNPPGAPFGVVLIDPDHLELNPMLKCRCASLFNA